MNGKEVKSGEKEQPASEPLSADSGIPAGSDKTQSGKVDDPESDSRKAGYKEEEGEVLLTPCGRATWVRQPIKRLCPELIREIWTISAM